jgi:Mrp family chromosome partitioning ATPase/DUF971 family protein
MTDSTPNEAAVLDALRVIIDPDLGKDIVSLDFVKNVVIDGGDVSFTIELTTPACPVKEEFKARANEVVGKLPGVTAVNVTMGAMERKSNPDAGPNNLSNVGAIIAVSSCKGGVGKSTVAAHIARQLQRERFKVGLMDADVYGPSVPTLFGCRNPQVYMKDNEIKPIDIDGIQVMSLGFVLGDGPAVVRGPIVSSYTQQILKQTAWGELDYLIIDFPPGTGDIQLTLVQQAEFDGAVIVTTPQALSLVDVARGILMFEKVDVPVLGLVENMSYFECDGCNKRHHIYGDGAHDLKKRFGIETLAQLPILPGLSNLEAVEAGANVPEIHDMVDKLHRAVGKARVTQGGRPEVTKGTNTLEIKWPDGTTDSVPNREVRAGCQCANCVHEFTGEQILDKESIPETIQAETITPLGNYAVGIAWSDGHSSGIYTWDYFRELAQGVSA